MHDCVFTLRTRYRVELRNETREVNSSRFTCCPGYVVTHTEPLICTGEDLKDQMMSRSRSSYTKVR